MYKIKRGIFFIRTKSVVVNHNCGDNIDTGCSALKRSTNQAIKLWGGTDYKTTFLE